MNKNSRIKISKILIKIYGEEFGKNKTADRPYTLSRRQFLDLADTKILSDVDLMKIKQFMHKKDFILTDLGSDFSVIKDSDMLNWRKLSKELFEEMKPKKDVDEKNTKKNKEGQSKKEKEQVKKKKKK